MKYFRFVFLLSLTAVWAYAGLVDFDGTGAPLLFSSTTALRDYYAGQGVHFAGSTGPNDGGAIVNDASFSVPAFSGTDFLAFNNTALLSDGGFARLNEMINFDDSQSAVSIYISGQGNGDYMQLEAFSGLDGTGTSLGFDQHTAPAEGWSQFVVNAAGIRSVIISGPDADGTFLADDLSYSNDGSAPEPAGLLLLPTGLLALAALRLRRRA